MIHSIYTSILHYAKGTCPFGQDCPGDPIWGVVGSVLAPGTRPDGRTSEIPENSGKNPEKPENSGKFKKLRVTYQIKALGMLVHVDTLKIQNSGKLGKIYGKTVKIPESHTFVA